MLTSFPGKIVALLDILHFWRVTKNKNDPASIFLVPLSITRQCQRALSHLKLQCFFCRTQCLRQRHHKCGAMRTSKGWTVFFFSIWKPDRMETYLMRRKISWKSALCRKRYRHSQSHPPFSLCFPAALVLEATSDCIDVIVPSAAICVMRQGALQKQSGQHQKKKGWWKLFSILIPFFPSPVLSMWPMATVSSKTSRDLFLKGQ